ncbi:MAG: 50S ribosomal protein L2 [Pseudomonadota bacterium]|jgi:large subunit ribosomal protein L2|nr:50S ribosomal protein L2 [Alphaproteobacteria bacterium]
MGLKKYKPTTKSQRQHTNIDRAELWKGVPLKKLTVGKSSKSGHNNYGRITSWNRGGGHKQSYRLIDFRRDKYEQVATVERIEYDPNRTGFIALLKYSDGEHRYILAPQRLKVGDQVIAGDKVDVKPGNSMRLKNIPIGSVVHNIELKVGKGGQIARSAGSYAQIMGRDGHNVIMKLSSGEVRLVNGECFASIGAMSNQDHSNRSYGKAGRMRWLGRRPVVRGVAMNPIDHPHGGGEGRTSGGRHPVTPWGIKTKGKKTRTNKRTTKMIVRRRKA